MYELHMPVIVLARIKLSRQEITPIEAKKEFNRGLVNLKLSVEMLKYEPDGTFESKVCEGAKSSIGPLEQFVRSLK